MEKGTTISHYKILEKLGEGGMGVVYKARDTRLDRDVALKFLPAHLGANDSEKQRFIHEAKAASALEHNNICSIYTIEETGDGNLFIVMAYYEGEPLAEKIDQGPLPLRDVVKYCTQIASGLQKAHEKGIVHRDLKPDNLFITQDDQVKIIDFGLAKAAQRTMLTKKGTTLGTVPYMSPEQAQGGEVDHRTDIWSLGVVIYEMLTGQRPFKSEYETALVYSILNEDPEPPTGLRTGVPMALENMVFKCLEKEPPERYQSINEVQVDLKRLEKKSSKTMKSVTDFRQPDKPGDSNAAIATGDSRAQEQPKKSSTAISLNSPISGMSAVKFIGIVLGLSAIAAFAVLYFPADKIPPHLPDRVAVSLFENRTGDREFDFLSKSLSDFLTQGILQIRVVDVVPSETIFSLDEASPGATLNSQHISDHTQATLVVSGSYMTQVDELSVNARVTDATQNQLIYSIGPVTGAKDRPGEVMEELQSRVKGAIAVLSGGDFDNWYHHFMRRPPSYEAYLEMTRGDDLFHRRHEFDSATTHFLNAFRIDSTAVLPLHFASIAQSGVGNIAKADSLISLAEEHDMFMTSLGSTFARAVRAQIHGDWHSSYREHKEIAAHLPWFNFPAGFAAIFSNRPYEAIDALRKIDPDHPYIGRFYVYWTHLTAAYHLTGDYEAELEAARNALTERPELLPLVYYEMRALAALGRIDEMHTRAEEVFALPALAGWSRTRVLRLTAEELRAHNNVEASRMLLERALHWYRTRPSDQFRELRLPYAVTLYHARQWKESQTVFEELLIDDPDNMTFRGYLGILEARQGNTQEAMRHSRWLGQLDGTYRFGFHTRWRARIAAVLGEYENAMSLLRDAFAHGLAYGVWIHSDPAFEGMRDFGPFQELLEPNEEVL